MCIHGKRTNVKDEYHMQLETHSVHRRMNIICSWKHTLYTEEVNKVVMSANDNKCVIRLNKVHTLAIGHHKTL